jgi:hypothetical protein
MESFWFEFNLKYFVVSTTTHITKLNHKIGTRIKILKGFIFFLINSTFNTWHHYHSKTDLHAVIYWCLISKSISRHTLLEKKLSSWKVEFIRKKINPFKILIRVPILWFSFVICVVVEWLHANQFCYGNDVMC